MSKPTSAVKRRWNKKNYDVLQVSVRKGQLPFLKQIAAEHDLSLSKLVTKAIEKYLAEEYKIDFDDYPSSEENK